MIERVLDILYKNKKFQWFMGLYMAVAILGGLAMVVLDQKGIVNIQTAERAYERIDKLEAELLAVDAQVRASKEELKRLNAISSAQLSPTHSISQASDATKKIDAIELNVTKLSDRVSALSSALNPTTPEEVLTLARLGDQVRRIDSDVASIKSSFDQAKKEMSAEIDRNQASVAKEIDRIVGIFQWLGLLLIPIVLNTLRDVFRPRVMSQGERDDA